VHCQVSPKPIRSWAQSGALAGAIGGSLLYVSDAWPDKPLPSENGGPSIPGSTRDAVEEYEALARSAWPFKLDYIDPLTMLPDPESEGQTYIIIAFKDTARSPARCCMSTYGNPQYEDELNLLIVG